MNAKGFFVAALSSALDLGIATPEDVLQHVTPDLLAAHLPRPLWARLFTACLGAPRVDARLVIETIGLPNLCEHIPSPTIWRCIEDLASRSLGGAAAVAIPSAPSAPVIVTRTPPQTPPKPLGVAAPPPEERKPPVGAAPVHAGPNIPKPSASSDPDGESASPSVRSRTPTGQRFRQTSTNIGRLAASNQRRPQAVVPTPPPAAEPSRAPSREHARETESDFDMETAVGLSNASKDEWKNALAVDDEQLVEWSTSDDGLTAAGDTDPHAGRKR